MDDDTASEAVLDQPSSIPLDPENAFKALSNSRRRRAILSISHATDGIAARDLAVEIAAIENGIQPSNVTSEQRTRVYIALTQQHLDALDEIAAIDYDARSKQARPTDATPALADIVRRVETACYDPNESDAIAADRLQEVCDDGSA